MNIYIANTTKTVNEVAALCERKVHDVDRRLRRISINMSLLEAKVDSAVASQNAAALPDTGEQPSASASDSQLQQVVEQPLSTAPSVSDGMEEIDVGTPHMLKNDNKNSRGLRADYENLQGGAP
ncbi:g11138 [Coccomyxa elongata]